jgi:ATP-dependent DNA helicase HFM1/MER3
VNLVLFGVAFHNAGLTMSIVKNIEAVSHGRLFDGHMFLTALVVGVNLPAHLMSLKGNQPLSPKETSEHSDLDIMQMIGRAGRPHG